MPRRETRVPRPRLLTLTPRPSRPQVAIGQIAADAVRDMAFGDSYFSKAVLLFALMSVVSGVLLATGARAARRPQALPPRSARPPRSGWSAARRG